MTYTPDPTCQHKGIALVRVVNGHIEDCTVFENAERATLAFESLTGVDYADYVRALDQGVGPTEILGPSLAGTCLRNAIVDTWCPPISLASPIKPGPWSHVA